MAASNCKTEVGPMLPQQDTAHRASAYSHTNTWSRPNKAANNLDEFC